jgi:hypothetical protein
MIVGGTATVGLAMALAGWLLIARASSSPALAAPPDTSALALVDRGLAGPAGPDDEGQYRLIDPIGPGGATATSAQDEVFASTMVGGLYTKWQPYHDPFTDSGGTYGRRGLDWMLP